MCVEARCSLASSVPPPVRLPRLCHVCTTTGTGAAVPMSSKVAGCYTGRCDHLRWWLPVVYIFCHWVNLAGLKTVFVCEPPAIFSTFICKRCGRGWIRTSDTPDFQSGALPTELPARPPVHSVWVMSPYCVTGVSSFTKTIFHNTDMVVSSEV